jgi:6-phosphogluconolactonase (cycloisomerase 2 family)
MRMKFNKKSQLLLVSAASLLAASLVTACGTLTVDFVFVTSATAAGTNNYGEIDVFEINSESGYMRQIPTSPFPSGGRTPVAETLSTDNSTLYVVNKDDNSIVQFTIGNDGKVYPQHTVNTPGIFPLGVTVSGNNLFVIDTYKPLPSCSNAAPCSGSVGVMPLATSSDTAYQLDQIKGNTANGTLSYWPLCLNGYSQASDSTYSCATTESHVVTPTGVAAVSKTLSSSSSSSSAITSLLFVTAYDSTANNGYLYGFSVGTDGALAPLSARPLLISAGADPTALVGDNSGNYLYVTDAASGNVLSYAISSSGTLSAVGSYASGAAPSAITMDPSANWVYVTNRTDSTIVAFSASNGVLTRLASQATGSEPVAVGVDPSHRHFVFTVNYLGSSLSGYGINTDGTLFGSQNSPYTTNTLPTAAVAIPHGGVVK